MSVTSWLWRSLLFSPTADKLTCKKRQALVSTANGIVALWGERSGPDARAQLAVLRLLGARGRAELATLDPARRLHAVSSMTWTLNPPSFGGSTGPLTLDSYCAAVVAAYDFVAREHENARLWVYGKSIGGTGALYLASQRPAHAVIAKNPINLPALTQRRLSRWLPRALVQAVVTSVPGEFDPVLAARRSLTPRALVITSRDDQLSLPESQAAIVRSYSGVAAVLEVEGGHDEQTLRPADEPRYRAAIEALWNDPATR